MTNFKEIPPFFGENKEANIARYLLEEYESGRSDLFLGLKELDFLNNFDSFEVSATIPAGTEQAFNNPKSYIPRRRVIVKHSGDPAIVDGDSPNTVDQVFLKNAGSVSATITVIYMR